MKNPNVTLCYVNVKKEIDTILEIDVTLEPVLFLLGAIPKALYNADKRYILMILLLVAKKMITVNWRDVKPPTIGQWTQRLKNVYMMERMTASLQLTMNTFMQRWTCISRYLGVCWMRCFDGIQLGRGSKFLFGKSCLATIYGYVAPLPVMVIGIITIFLLL